jgi:hypothetical protein
MEAVVVFEDSYKFLDGRGRYPQRRASRNLRGEETKKGGRNLVGSSPFDNV